MIGIQSRTEKCMTAKEKTRLRELAKQQRDLAYSPEMESLRKRYWDLNTKKSGIRPTVRIETEHV